MMDRVGEWMQQRVGIYHDGALLVNGVGRLGEDVIDDEDCLLRKKLLQ
jgi:hypothetical protein